MIKLGHPLFCWKSLLFFSTASIVYSLSHFSICLSHPPPPAYLPRSPLCKQLFPPLVPFYLFLSVLEIQNIIWDYFVEMRQFSSTKTSKVIFTVNIIYYGPLKLTSKGSKRISRGETGVKVEKGKTKSSNIKLEKIVKRTRLISKRKLIKETKI